MSHPTLAELKKILRDKGFEIYRTTPTEVVLAERVRENLLMDSGVAARGGDDPGVRVVMRAEGSKFPSQNPDQLWAHARDLAKAALDAGYREVDARVTKIQDPSDPERTLDTWYEIWLERSVSDDAELLRELTVALGLHKTA
jgi:hypothetical protein